MAFYELRQYKVRPGKIDERVKIMEEEIIPFQVSNLTDSQNSRSCIHMDSNRKM